MESGDARAAAAVPVGPVLFAYDGSELAAHAIEQAGRQLVPGREALVLCVWQPSDVGFTPPQARAFDAANAAEVRALAEETAAHGASLAEKAGFRAEGIAIPAAPTWQGIVQVAAERGAALIVLGAHRRGGLAGHLLGSVTEAVLAHGGTSVLVVQAQDRSVEPGPNGQLSTVAGAAPASGTGSPGRAAHDVRAVSARARVLVAAAAGAAGALIVALVGPWWLVPLSAWDCGALVFIAWIHRSLGHLDGAGTMRYARREDPSRAAADLVLLGASVVSLLAVGLVLVRASNESGLVKDLLVGLTVLSVVLAWSIVHTVYTLRYARLYYTQGPGGVDFNEREAPSYGDFLYLALTVGMTFQVSDTDLTTKPIRRTAIRHALLSYLFGVVIIAASINLTAGLLTK